MIFYAGNAILLVAVYNIGEGCQLCNLQDNQNPSKAFLWDHSRRQFKKNHFQHLPSTRYIHSYPERYRNRNTVISVFTGCDCNTKLYYLDVNNSRIVFNEIERDNNLLFRDIMVVQSMRYQGTQYVLFAPLNRFNKNEPISIYKWRQSSGSLHFHRNLSTYINGDTGLSTAVFKDEVFLCSVSQASKNVTLYRLKPDRGHLREIKHMKEDVEFSMCNFFGHSHELYVAIGFQRRVELLRYSPVARTFTHAGKLPGAGNAIDLMCFQSRDDTYIITTGNCSRKRKNNTTYCRKTMYRRVNS